MCYEWTCCQLQPLKVRLKNAMMSILLESPSNPCQAAHRLWPWTILFQWMHPFCPSLCYACCGPVSVLEWESFPLSTILGQRTLILNEYKMKVLAANDQVQGHSLDSAAIRLISKGLGWGQKNTLSLWKPGCTRFQHSSFPPAKRALIFTLRTRSNKHLLCTAFWEGVATMSWCCKWV